MSCAGSGFFTSSTKCLAPEAAKRWVSCAPGRRGRRRSDACPRWAVLPRPSLWFVPTARRVAADDAGLIGLLRRDHRSRPRAHWRPRRHRPKDRDRSAHLHVAGCSKPMPRPKPRAAIVRHWPLRRLRLPAPLRDEPQAASECALRGQQGLQDKQRSLASLCKVLRRGRTLIDAS